MEKLYPTDVYDYLPHSNCKRCGEDNCMAFAHKLTNQGIKLSSCAPLRLPEQAKNRRAIEAMLVAKIMEVEG